jgi:hypothetical protein
MALHIGDMLYSLAAEADGISQSPVRGTGDLSLSTSACEVGPNDRGDQHATLGNTGGYPEVGGHRFGAPFRRPYPYGLALGVKDFSLMPLTPVGVPPPVNWVRRSKNPRLLRPSGSMGR